MKPCYIIRSHLRTGAPRLHEITVYSNNKLDIGIYSISKTYYKITFEQNQPVSCSCQDHKLIKSICEHIAFVMEKIFDMRDLDLFYIPRECDFDKFEKKRLEQLK